MKPLLSLQQSLTPSALASGLPVPLLRARKSMAISQSSLSAEKVNLTDQIACFRMLQSNADALESAMKTDLENRTISTAALLSPTLWGKLKTVEGMMNHYIAVVKRGAELLSESCLFSVDSGSHVMQNQIGFGFPGFQSQTFIVGKVSVLRAEKFFKGHDQYSSFNHEEWESALSSVSPAKTLMQHVPDVDKLYEQGKEEDAKRILRANALHLLHCLCLGAFVNTRLDQILKGDLKLFEWNQVNEILEKHEKNLPFPEKYYVNPDAETIRLYLHGAIKTFDSVAIICDQHHWVYTLAIVFDFRSKLLDSLLQTMETLAKEFEQFKRLESFEDIQYICSRELRRLRRANEIFPILNMRNLVAATLSMRQVVNSSPSSINESSTSFSSTEYDIIRSNEDFPDLSQLDKKLPKGILEPRPKWNLSSIKDDMSRSLRLKDRIRNFRKYENCFAGDEANNFLLSRHYADSEPEALHLGNLLLSEGFIKSAMNEDTPFINSKTQCYWFVEDRRHSVRSIDLNQELVELSQSKSDESHKTEEKSEIAKQSSSEELFDVNSVNVESVKLVVVSDLKSKKLCFNVTTEGQNRDCAYGTEIAKSILSTQNYSDVKHAISVGKKLVESGHLRHAVLQNAPFFDQKTLYYFLEPSKLKGMLRTSIVDRAETIFEEKSEIDYEDLCYSMMSSIKVRDIKAGSALIYQCFSGADAIKYLISAGHARTSEEAQNLCQKFVERRLVMNAWYSSIDFRSEDYLYRFAAHRYSSDNPQIM